MTNEFEHIQFIPIENHRYEKWFHELKYNGKELNDSERSELVKVVDDIILDFSGGLPLLQEILDQKKNLHDEFNEAYKTVISVTQFVVITMTDIIVSSKYFILADKDYDRRFMRGKMKVIINEGFKKLYGFEEKTHQNSEWTRLAPILNRFPELIHQQYNYLSSLLENHSKSSSWCRDERNVETHLDIEKLYLSRCEDVIESKVMMESLKLFETLQAVNLFLKNMHTCFLNFLVDKIQYEELK